METCKLIQFQCQKEGTLFYYQHIGSGRHLVRFCPLCGSKRVAVTGRKFTAVRENRPLTRAEGGAR
jgi:hypothetical protein